MTFMPSAEQMTFVSEMLAAGAPIGQIVRRIKDPATGRRVSLKVFRRGFKPLLKAAPMLRLGSVFNQLVRDAIAGDAAAAAVYIDLFMGGSLKMAPPSKDGQPAAPTREQPKMRNAQDAKKLAEKLVAEIAERRAAERRAMRKEARTGIYR